MRSVVERNVVMRRMTVINWKKKIETKWSRNAFRYVTEFMWNE